MLLEWQRTVWDENEMKKQKGWLIGWASLDPNNNDYIAYHKPYYEPVTGFVSVSKLKALTDFRAKLERCRTALQARLKELQDHINRTEDSLLTVADLIEWTNQEAKPEKPAFKKRRTRK